MSWWSVKVNCTLAYTQGCLRGICIFETEIVHYGDISANLDQAMSKKKKKKNDNTWKKNTHTHSSLRLTGPNFAFGRNFWYFFARSLTLKWPRYFYSRWCPRGGFHGTPVEKTIFPPEFCNEICTIYVRDIKNHNSAKKKLNVVPFQNGGQITDFCFASFRFWPNFEKPLFQRNFSMKFGSKKENMNRFTLLK